MPNVKAFLKQNPKKAQNVLFDLSQELHEYPNQESTENSDYGQESEFDEPPEGVLNIVEEIQKNGAGCGADEL